MKVPGWIRLLLRLYPREFRRAHGDEVTELVREELGRAAGARPGARLVVACRVAFDLIRGGLRSRRPGPGVRPGRGPGRGSVERFADGGLEIVRAIRSLARVPLFAGTVIVTVALGVGLSTAVFSVLNAVVLRPLDYREPERLVRVTSTISGVPDVLVAGGTLSKLAERQRVFDAVAGVATIRQNLTGTAVPRQVDVGWTSPGFFDVLGIVAAMGRTYGPSDPMGTAMLSNEAWRRDFGSDPDVLGRSVQLDGSPYTIVGVLPPGFRLHLGPVPREIDVWKVPDDWWQNGDVWSAEGAEFGLLRVIGRLSEGMDLEMARSDVARVAAGLRDEVPDYLAGGFDLGVTPLHGLVVSRARPLLTMLMAAVIAVVLIVCANVVGLLLVRAEDRRQEIALRLALGSGRGGIVSHLLSESFVLAGAGGILGIGVALAGIRLLPRFAPPDVPRLGEASLDATVLAFAFGATVACMLLFALSPAPAVVRRGARQVLSGVRATAAGGRTRSVLVVLQICASMVLLVAAVLFATSMNRLQSVDPGFDADGVLSFAVSLPGARYDWPEGAARFYEALARRIEEMPGVESAAMLWPLPLAGRSWSGAVRGGRLAEDDRYHARYDLVTPELFETLRVPLVEGRTFEAADPRGVVIVSRSLAEKAWPGRSALGRQLRAFPWGQDTLAFTVIGVADDIRFDSLREPPSDVVYFANAGWVWTDWEVNFVVRANGDPFALTDAIRSAVQSMDPLIPIADVRLLRSFIDRETATLRFARAVFAVFAGVAAFLAVLGLYGVIAYGVRRRRREFGIRLALGSGNPALLGLVVRQGAVLALTGVGTGAVIAIWTGGLLRASLFGVSTMDPIVYLFAGSGLITAGVLAALVPARSVTRVDPARVLRAE